MGSGDTLCEVIIVGMIAALALAWVAFSIYTGILIFGVERDVECFTDEAGTPVDVAKRFSNTLIVLFTSQLCITISIILLWVSLCKRLIFLYLMIASMLFFCGAGIGIIATRITESGDFCSNTVLP